MQPRRDPEKLKECEKTLVALAGSTKRREILSSRKLSCLGCVEKIAESLENI